MFALIRHAGYSPASGSLTQEGVCDARLLVSALQNVGTSWMRVCTSPTTRTRETATIFGMILGIPVHVDDHLASNVHITEYLPPIEPIQTILITHLPVATHVLRAWSRFFDQEEPSLIEVACGYLIHPSAKQILAIKPGMCLKQEEKRV